MEQQSKEVELVHLKALLDEKAAREKGLTIEIYELKKRLEEEERHRKEAELRSTESYIEVRNYCSAMEEFGKQLDLLHSTVDMLMEEMRALGECSNIFPHFLDEAKESMKKALLYKKALKCKVQRLVAELEGCRKELDTKSNQYEDTVGSMVALQEKLQELQQCVQDLSAENALLLAEKEALADKVKDFDELQEEKALLEACLRKLAGSLCSHLDLENTSTLAVSEALGSALQLLLLENSSLRDKEGLNDSTVKELTTEKAKHLFDWRHQANKMSELNDECVQKDMELLRLNVEAANSASTIRDLKDENKRLYEGITNFEQLALQSADDLDRAQREIASLKEALATAQMEALPVEEREKAALLLIEEESRISFLEEKLKEMEGAMAKLNQEMMEACKIADVLRDANEGLKNALLSRDKELKENRAPTAKRRKFFTSEDDDTDEFFKTSLV